MTASTPPEGAQKSEDGHYWWDESAQQWQPVDQSGGQDPSQSPSDAASAAGAAAGGQEQPQVNWSQCPNLYQLLAAQTLEDWLQAAGLDPQLLHGEHGGDSAQQLTSEFQMLQQLTQGGDPAQADVHQLVQLLMTGASGTPFLDILKQLAQQLREGGDSNADQLDELVRTLEQEVQQLQYAAQ